MSSKEIKLLAIASAASLFACGCHGAARDLTLLTVRVADADAPAMQPHRLLLRVEFHAAENLLSVAAAGKTVFLHSFFCHRPTEFAVLNGPAVYFDGDVVQAAAYYGKSLSPDAAEHAVYYFFIDTHRDASPLSKPAQVGFDLRSAAEDICFYVTGSGELGRSYKSNVATIPKSIIAAAFSEKGPAVQTP
jgi:hypothetical protein